MQAAKVVAMGVMSGVTVDGSLTATQGATVAATQGATAAAPTGVRHLLAGCWSGATAPAASEPPLPAPRRRELRRGA